LFFNSSGSIGLVETPFEFHIIKVTDKQDGIRLAAALRWKLLKLLQTAFTQATKFEMDATEKISVLYQRDGTQLFQCLLSNG
jgi:peptidyl-prolyl cis-trans isomerase D